MFNKTVDSILSVFTKTIKELEDHASKQDVDVDTFTTTATMAAARAQAARLEAKRARDAASQIKGIFNGPSS
jgi:hypothetical protein